ncbi:hypothetical protein D3Z46_05915 [Bacteroides sartorii]|nr:hypothetical protein [Phocaeicola sartorii]
MSQVSGVTLPGNISYFAHEDILLFQWDMIVHDTSIEKAEPAFLQARLSYYQNNQKSINSPFQK